MEVRKGIAVSGGVVIAHALVLDAEEYRIARRSILPRDVDHEKLLFERALEASRSEVLALRDQAQQRMGPEAAGIFDFHHQMLNDASLLRQIHETITRKLVAAAYAVATVLQAYESRFAGMNDEFFAERAKDITDIKKRLLRQVLGEEREDLAHLTEEVILVSHDLTPGQVAALDQTLVRGFATDVGGRTGHAAIIARSMGLPGLVGLGNASTTIHGGDLLILDGYHGILVVQPDESTLARYRKDAERVHRVTALLLETARQPAITTDGQSVSILANIEFASEVDGALARGAEGVGLYRTEYAYLSRQGLPGEEELYESYRAAAVACENRPLVIRTMDLGGDKLPETHWEEANPFLGCRSIRYCLHNIELFKTQLRAILRASVAGDVRMMFPLITSVMEVRQAKSLVRHVMEDLDEERIPYNPQMRIGVMIETPAAALTARVLADEVDFFSIGTNDLIQYTLAVDRGNERVASLFTPAHPAVLGLIRDVIVVGRRKGVDVSVCGEMAGEVDFALLLLGMGLTSYSMSAAGIPEIKKMVRSVSLVDATRVARKVLSFESERQVLNYLRDESRKLVQDLIG